MTPLLPDPPVTGGQKRTLRLIEAIERAGAKPHLLSTDPGTDGAAARLRERDWTVEVLPEPSVSLRSRLRQHADALPSPYLGTIAARLRELVAEGASLVQLEHTQSAYYLDDLAGRVPVVLSLHNVDSALALSVARAEPVLSVARARKLNRWRGLRAVERRSLPRADAVLAVSREDCARLASLGATPVLVPNGVDDSVFALSTELPAGEDVLFFGALDYEPNTLGLVRFLEEGWPRVRSARPAAVLRIAGTGRVPALERLIARTAGVELVGRVPDISAELARSSAVVVPIWLGGGTRLKVLESMGAARPIVGTPLGVEGLGFTHGVHGLVAEAPADLAGETARILADSQLAAGLADGARTLAEAFRWPLVTAPAEEVYRSMIAAGEGAEGGPEPNRRSRAVDRVRRA